MNNISYFLLILQPPSDATEPTECTAANEGSCECAETSQGFQTYTFYVDGVQRCFTIYSDPDRAGQNLPVVFTPNCYAKDKLQGLEAKSPFSQGNKAAARFGYARIALSTPDGGWTFGNNGIINDNVPMPCSDSDR